MIIRPFVAARLMLMLIGVALSSSVSGQGGLLASLSADLVRLVALGDPHPVRAIVRGDVDTVLSVAGRDGLSVARVLDGFVVLVATPGELDALRSVPGIEAISRDARVAPMMTVSDRAMGADQARQASSGLLGLGSLPAVSGRGVGVAIVDSGIARHPALDQKVVAAVSFVSGDPSVDDGFGHGTHIAGIVSGSGRPASTVTPLYRGGVAPDAHLVNVRVLDAGGTGYTSDVIAGVQWVVANRERYAIRVMNLSLGHPIVEPCVTDPLCLSVERAAAAGLVVVVSAGNSGKDADGRQVLASVTTPGNAAQAITVGALNTWGTVARDDDTVTTYSSRGPTKFDLRVKPDVVAPGNKIVSLGVRKSYLARMFPAQHIPGPGGNSYQVMSGTSMAAAMVSGSAALLLDGGPTLTARQIKAALQLSASFMPADGIVAAGAGAVNVYSARRVQGALQSLTGAIPSATIGGRTANPGGLLVSESGSMVDQGAGVAGVTVLDLFRAWSDPGRLGRGARLLGLLNPLLAFGPVRLFFGGLAGTVGQQIVWSDTEAGGLQIVWSDASTAGQQIVWSDSDLSHGYHIVWSDQSSTEGNQIVWSDRSRTEGNQIVWSDTVGGGAGDP